MAVGEPEIYLAVLKASYDHEPQHKDEVAIKENQLLLLIEKVNEEWWKVKVKAGSQDRDSSTGLVPAAYVEQAKHTSIVRAMYNYDATLPGELSLHKFDKLLVFLSEAGWLLVQNSTVEGKAGYVPGNYVEAVDEKEPFAPSRIIVPDFPSQPHVDPRKAGEAFASALYDFTADGEDELSITEGERLVVVEKDGDEWWKCRNMKGAEGVVPASYLEAAEDEGSTTSNVNHVTEERKAQEFARHREADRLLPGHEEDGEMEKVAAACKARAKERAKQTVIAAVVERQKQKESPLAPSAVSYVSAFLNGFSPPPRHSQEPSGTSAANGGLGTFSSEFDPHEPAFDHKGKQKEPDYEFLAPPANNPSKEVDKSLGLKPWQVPNRGWEYIRRIGATGGKLSYPSWLTGNPTESWRIRGMDFIRDTQDRELAKALRESKIASNSDVVNKADHHAFDPQIAQYRELAKARMESMITSNSDLPDYSRQMGLDESPTPPAQKRAGDSDTSTSKLALELQRLYDEEDRQLDAERSALQKSVQAEFFDCGICFENFRRDNIAEFDSCKHCYCRSCLQEYISSTLQERRYPITCPECNANKSSKPAEIDDSMFRSLGATLKDLQVFYELQLASHSVLLHCRKCEQTMNVDRGQYQVTSIITCPLPACRYTWCKDCQQVVLRGGPEHSCDGASELKLLMEKKGWRHCPGCQVPIQKSSGCHHMSCLAPGCNTHFCYLCGEKIIQSAGPGVREAVKAHYRKCRMYEHQAEDAVLRIFRR